MAGFRRKANGLLSLVLDARNSDLSSWLPPLERCPPRRRYVSNNGFSHALLGYRHRAMYKYNVTTAEVKSVFLGDSTREHWILWHYADRASVTELKVNTDITWKRK